MREPAKSEAAAVLQAVALRYAAGDLPPSEAAAFESRLATDQTARDALGEAVRLSAAALGQSPPSPDNSLRASVRDRLLGWWPGWLARRPYRGHPLAWAVMGAVTVAGATLMALSIPEQDIAHQQLPAATAPASGPMPSVEVAGTLPAEGGRGHEPETVAIIHVSRDPAAADGGAGSAECSNPSVAEIWAALSKPDHLEKAHEEEFRFRQKLKEMGPIHSGRIGPGAGIGDAREP
jgi:hypothetical protein